MSAPEEWRAVPGYEGLYEVSDLGRVRSCDRTIMQRSKHGTMHPHPIKGRILRPGASGNFGHRTVALGRGNSKMVHALVAAAFVGPRPVGLDVCHKNSDGGDNRASNLYYGTRSDNNRDASRNGKRKLSVEAVHSLRRRNTGRSADALALSKEYGVCVSQIWNVWTGRHYSHV